MKISIIINADTRDGFQNEQTSANQMFDGCKSADFLTEGVINKRAFFSGFDTEVIVYVDEHVRIPTEILEKLNTITDTLIIRKHTAEYSFNDYNYLRALSMASGDIIVHCDSDTACFTSSKRCVQEYIDLLEEHTVVSYPHWFSPNPDVNDNYDYWWSSTRFFMCKREFLDIAELMKMLKDYDYTYKTYPASIKNHWLEHLIGLLAKYRGNGTFYPPLEICKLAIFSWSSYKSGTLESLNKMDYTTLKTWLSHHPIHFPNDVNC